MKILYVSADDYAALSFEAKFQGTPVIDIINDLDKYQADEDDGYWELEVTEVEGTVSKEFIDYVKGKMDYDDTKHTMWYHEMETL